MEEILPGIFHWTAFHEGIQRRVSSYYIARDPAALIDPMLPEEGLEWFHGHERPRRILLTNPHHYRHSEGFVEAFGCPVLCHEAGLHEFEGGPAVQAFADGLIRAPDGSLGFVPDSLIGDDPEAVKRGVRHSLRCLLEHQFDSLLFAHGAPLVGGGRSALREFAGSG